MRRVESLILGLPFNDAVVWQAERAERLERDHGWTVTDHLLASQIETTHMVFRAVLASIPRTRPVKLPEPLHIPRPGEQRKEPRRVTPFELIQTLRG